MSQKSQLTQREGNTIPRARRWVGTLNNWNDDEYVTLSHDLQIKNYNFIIGKEVGEQGTPHLQIYIESKNAIRFETLKNLCPRAHWEPAKGDRESNLTYCSKEGDFQTNIVLKAPLKVLKESQLYPWQKEIEDLIQIEPDDRTIHWYWDPDGCKGKTQLIKYLCSKYKSATFSCATKSADILTIADPDYEVYLLNFTRTQEGFAPYTALEQLKDGLISDSKLKKESRQIIMNSPHVICFANWPPNEDALSRDRWRIVRIGTAPRPEAPSPTPFPCPGEAGPEVLVGPSGAARSLRSLGRGVPPLL